MSDTANVASRLSQMAQQRPNAVAVAEPLGRDAHGKRRYRHVTFRELDEDSRQIADGLRAMGVVPGTRLALLVRPGIDFVSLVFALLKARAVAILIDPGMGRKSLIRCLAEAEPQGFVAIPIVQAVRSLLPWRFWRAKLNVTVGRRWFWGGATLAQLRNRACPRRSTAEEIAERPFSSDDPAAIIFTTGSTGPPKGVLYTHGNFDAQVEQIRDFYGIRPGEIDLPAFPLFGLFNCAMGVTAVIPDMDPSRPGRVDPANIIEAVRDWNVTQTFGSPTIWDRVGRHCQEHAAGLPTVRRVLSAGAPVAADVLRRMKACIHPEGDVHTPYGATEALPVASIAASEVLGGDWADENSMKTGTGTATNSGLDRATVQPVAEPVPVFIRLGGDCPDARGNQASGTGANVVAAQTGPSPLGCGTAVLTRQGAGVCVGRPFPRIRWKVIRIVNGPIQRLSDAVELPPGEIGELIVSGPQVTRQYVTRTEANPLAKIIEADGTRSVPATEGDGTGSGPAANGYWHRMGDAGYFDGSSRFWFCGRVAHRVLTADGPMYPVCCEAIFNQHPAVRRSALVGVGPRGQQRPVIILEPHKGQMPTTREAKTTLLDEIRRLGAANAVTAGIRDFLLHPAFPVDIRHNAKIFREKLAVWAEGRYGP